VIDKAYDDLSKGGVWSVNDGMPQKLIDYTIGKRGRSRHNQSRETSRRMNRSSTKSIVDEAITRKRRSLDRRPTVVLTPLTCDPRELRLDGRRRARSWTAA